MRPFGPLPRTPASSTPSSRAKRRTDGDACGLSAASAPVGPTEGRAPISTAKSLEPGDPAGAGAGARGAGAGAPSGAGAGAAEGGALSALDARSVRIGVPSDTLSPTFTCNASTTPSAGEGISIEALSDSTVISDCSLPTLSPGFTSTSITSTSLKSPMSGTLTVSAAAGVAAAGWAGGALAGGGALGGG